MKLRKLLHLALALLMMLSAIPANAAVTEKGVLPIVDEPVTLRVAVPVYPNVEDINTNAFTLWLEEQTGINLDIIELSMTDVATQVNTILMSGDLPDMFIGYDFSYPELVSAAEAGLLLSLNKYIEAYGHEYFQFLDEVSGWISSPEAYVTLDGNVYAIPGVLETINAVYAGWKMRFQGMFLDALNMTPPATLDELYEFLIKVRDIDVNGNGDSNDEIPMTGYAKNIMLLQNIGNAYQYTDALSFLKVNDGVISFVANNDLFKETIEYIKKLVDEKLLDPAIFTQDQATLLTMNTKEYPIIGVDASYMSGNYNSASEVYANLRINPNLEGPHGYKSTNVKLPTITRGIVITSACKYPEIAFRLGDFLLSNDASIHARHGVFGENWTNAEEGQIGRNGEQAKYQLLGEQVWTWPTQNAIWRIESFGHADVMNWTWRGASGSVAALCSDMFSYNLDKEFTKEQVPSLVMDAETAAEYAEVKNLIIKHVNENFAKFVLGDRPMSDWGNYCSEIDSMGLDYYLQLAQEAYDSMK